MVSARIFERKVFITNDTRNMKTILKNEFILIFTVRFRYPSIWLISCYFKRSMLQGGMNLILLTIF